MASFSPFMTRLLRPFTSSTRSLTPESNASIPLPPGTQRATLAAGCFWGVEHLFRRQFSASTPHGIISTAVGYIGGDASNPSYGAVCTGRTNHAEALQITFDPEKVSYRQLLEYFFKMHDPTTKDRQGGDSGTQYRSAIFTEGEEQARVAKVVRDKVQKEWWRSGSVVTEIVPAGQWWDAETYHQKYLDKNPGGYECPAHYARTFPPLSKD